MINTISNVSDVFPNRMAKETMMVATELGELRECLVRHCNLRKDW